MPDHAIALRRAWEGRFGEETRRVDLPIDWSTAGEVPSRLSRVFQRPPIDPEREALLIRFESVPGLRSVLLNGRDLGQPAADGTPWECGIDDATPRANRLILGLEPAHFPPDSEWGRISIVVRVREGSPRDRRERL